MLGCTSISPSLPKNGIRSTVGRWSKRPERKQSNIPLDKNTNSCYNIPILRNGYFQNGVREMSKDYSPKLERQIVRRLINQGLFEEAEASIESADEEYEKFLEKQERRALRKARKGKRKDWDDDYA